MMASSFASRWRRRCLMTILCVGAGMVSGCKALSPDGGMALVGAISVAELGTEAQAIRTPHEEERARELVRQRLARPLSAKSAVEIALLNNRGLQAAYNELGIAEAIMVEASRPPIPTLSIERIASAAELEIERRVVANVLALITLPKRAKIAADRFRQAQLQAAEATLRVAGEARRAFYQAVASRQIAAALADAQTAAGTANELVRRLGRTGAVSKLDQARQQVFYAEVTTQLASARQQAASDRERLVRALGLWGRDLEFRLPDALPPLPKQPRALPLVEREALLRRVDLQVAMLEVEALAKSYGATKKTRLLEVLEVAGIAQKARDEMGEWSRAEGFELEIQVPLFDLGKTRLRQAEQTYLQAVNRLAEKAVNVRSEARQAYHAYRSAYDIALHYEREILPLRQIIADETLLQYNAMMIDVLELLAEARQRAADAVAAVEAKREFWLAAADLDAAIAGGGGGDSLQTSGAVASVGPQSGGH